jgi:hypothetical protein
MHPFISSRRRSRGLARISLGLAGTAVCPKHQAIGGRPGTDHGESLLAEATITGAPQLLAIHRYDLVVGQLADRPNPTQKAAAEFDRIEPGKDPSKRIVGRDPIRQLEKGLEPAPIGFAPQLDLHPGIRTAKDGADGNNQNVKEQMLLGIACAWVWK